MLQAPTLVLAECVLVYLDAAEAAAVVAALGSLLPNAVFAVYEQVMHTPGLLQALMTCWILHFRIIAHAGMMLTAALLPAADKAG